MSLEPEATDITATSLGGGVSLDENAVAIARETVEAGGPYESFTHEVEVGIAAYLAAAGQVSEGPSYRKLARDALAILQQSEDPHEGWDRAKALLANGLADLALAAVPVSPGGGEASWADHANRIAEAERIIDERCDATFAGQRCEARHGHDGPHEIEAKPPSPNPGLMHRWPNEGEREARCESVSPHGERCDLPAGHMGRHEHDNGLPGDSRHDIGTWDNGSWIRGPGASRDRTFGTPSPAGEYEEEREERRNAERERDEAEEQLKAAGEEVERARDLIRRALDDDQDGYRLAPHLEKEMLAFLAASPAPSDVEDEGK